MIKLSQIFDFLMPRLFFDGGGGGPSSTTVTQSNVPDWLKPQVTGMLDRATQELFQTSVVGTDEEGNPIYEIGAPKPFQPYSTDAAAYVAGQTPIQQSAIDLVFNTPTPWEYTRAADFLSDAGWNAKNMATLGLGYGATGAQSGQLAQEIATRGGAYYGGLGAGYGMAGAQLAPEAAQLGRLGTEIGRSSRESSSLYGGQFGGLGVGYGGLAAGLSPEAQQYGATAADIGRMGLRAEELGRQIGGVAGGYAGQAADIGGLYERMATSPGDVSRYMSPYVDILTQAQQQEAIRQAQIAGQARKTAAARAGAFGGSRQAIEEAEANRALQTQLQNIQSQNLAAAYQQAQANILNRAQLGLQGLSGAQQGLGTALQGGQLGLSGIGQAMAGQQAGLQGLGQAGQLYGLGMQGAQIGLQGMDRQLAGAELGLRGAGMGLQGLGQAGQMYGLGMQGAGMGLQGIQQQLAGTSQGMQGAGMGLQGIQQALGGYGLMGQMGGQLGQLGGQRLGANLDLASARFALGEQQRTLNQQIINQAIQNYAAAQETPFQRLSAYSALLRGYATPGQTTTQYQAAPPVASQLAGLGIAGLGLSGLGGGTGRKAGGTIKASDGVDTLALNRALAGA